MKEIPKKKKVTPRKRTKRESTPVLDATANGVTDNEADEEPRETKYWLMKAEPESRVVKGKVCLAQLNDS